MVILTRKNKRPNLPLFAFLTTLAITLTIINTATAQGPDRQSYTCSTRSPANSENRVFDLQEAREILQSSTAITTLRIDPTVWSSLDRTERLNRLKAQQRILLKKYHPDLYSSIEPHNKRTSVQKIADEVLKKIRASYVQLKAETEALPKTQQYPSTSKTPHSHQHPGRQRNSQNSSGGNFKTDKIQKTSPYDDAPVFEEMSPKRAQSTNARSKNTGTSSVFSDAPIFESDVSHRTKSQNFNPSESDKAKEKNSTANSSRATNEKTTSSKSTSYFIVAENSSPYLSSLLEVLNALIEDNMEESKAEYSLTLGFRKLEFSTRGKASTIEFYLRSAWNTVFQQLERKGYSQISQDTQYRFFKSIIGFSNLKFEGLSPSFNQELTLKIMAHAALNLNSPKKINTLASRADIRLAPLFGANWLMRIPWVDIVPDAIFVKKDTCADMTK